jgi:hypothetical protein
LSPDRRSEGWQEALIHAVDPRMAVRGPALETAGCLTAPKEPGPAFMAWVLLDESTSKRRRFSVIIEMALLQHAP